MKKAQSKLKSLKPNESKEKANANDNNLFGPWQKSPPSKVNPFKNLCSSPEQIDSFQRPKFNQKNIYKAERQALEEKMSALEKKLEEEIALRKEKEGIIAETIEKNEAQIAKMKEYFEKKIQKMEEDHADVIEYLLLPPANDENYEQDEESKVGQENEGHDQEGQNANGQEPEPASAEADGGEAHEVI